MATTSTTTTTDQPRSPFSNEIFLGFCFAIGCAAVLAIVGDLRESAATQTSTPEMFRLSNALVTGALGFFAGRATAWAQQRSTGNAVPPGGGDASANPIPQQPKE